MDTKPPTIASFLSYLGGSKAPFAFSRRATARELDPDDAPMHSAMFEHNPRLYALMSLHETTTTGQRARVLFEILRRSWSQLETEPRRILERVSDLLMALLPPDVVLTVFLGLRRVRANHKHSSRAIMRYILNHPHLESMAHYRRPALRDSLEHAVGKAVMRGIARMLAGNLETNEAYIHDNLLRYARDPQRARAVLAYLYHTSVQQQPAPQPDDPQEMVPVENPGGKPAPEFRQDHLAYTALWGLEYERSDTVTATNRGDIAATLVHIYGGGTSAELETALDAYVEKAASKLPRFSGRVALVLDASLSTRGYGGREYCCIAQSVALTRVMEANCSNLRVHLAGGAGDMGKLPIPGGSTDLAGALLDALEAQPDVVAILSDGYENLYRGDLARVAASLPGAGINTPVIFCHSKFSHSDDLALRRPAPHMEQVEFWHQSDFEDVLLRIFALPAGEETEKSTHDFFLDKLGRMERELDIWTM